MKIRTVAAELFHADRQTDMTRITIAFRSFAKAPKKGLKRPTNVTDPTFISAASCHFLSVRSKHSSQQFVFRCLRSVFKMIKKWLLF